MLPQKIFNALKIFYTRVQDKDIYRILSWSVSLAIQWVDIIPSEDIDILTDKEWSEVLDKLLQEFVITPSKYSWTEKYQSYFGIYRVGDVQLEIMGEMQYRLKDGSRSKLNQTHKIKRFVYKDMDFPVLSLEQELQEYENMGRADKVLKIRKAIDWDLTS